MESGPASALALFQEAFSQFTTRFDPRDLAPVDRGPALELLSRAEKALSVMAAMTASLMATEPAGRFGFVRPMQARLVANRCAGLWGVTPETANRALATGGRLLAQPEVSEVALAGGMSLHQAALVTDAVQADPAAATFLIETSRCGTLRGLAAECQRVKISQDNARQDDDRDPGPRGAGGAPDGGREDDDAPSPASGHRRHLRSWLDRRGGWHLSACGTVQDGETIMTAIRRFMPEVAADTATARHTPGSAAALDGLVALSEEAAGVVGVVGEASASDWGGLFSEPSAPKPRRARARRRTQTAPTVPFPNFSPDCLDWLFDPSDEGG